MMEFLEAMLAFPTVLYTILLGVVIVYWAFVVIGALDMDFLDVHLDLDGVGEAAGGALDGAGEAASGALDGLDGIDGAADGAAEGVGEALNGGHAGHLHAEGAEHAHEGLAGFLSALGLRGVPLTVAFSFVTLFAWLASFATMQAIGSLGESGLVRFLVGTGVGVGSLGVSLAATRLAVKPLERFFVTHHSRESDSLVGEVCRISTSRVDDGFGQAEVEDGGAGLLIQVRCADKTLALGRGDRALIIEYDKAGGVFHVVPYDNLLGGPDPG